ncbi:outer membrane lipid asymmetry maintenance protein MlaD [Paraferrimonas sp. SM1919]|uniref:outer membrane lipid asymmetry maintenance protein MlaD n=1 Tax=Paraferrimonas sp. SM1919 TaxID=2662263 RepID=UPI0013D6927D|nr:outer membrane lipid asymmetry maintenance protein MlaD [Paraferrimonas sp. SM1919]
MNSRKLEALVGLFILAGIGAFLVLAIKVANSEIGSDKQTYKLTAIFDNIGGLKTRSPIKVGGVVIGRVESITLDPETLQPLVIMNIDKQYSALPETSSLSILTAGLLGEQYLGLTPGFVDDDIAMLADGDRVEDTRSAIVLEDLIGQFLFSIKSED